MTDETKATNPAAKVDQQRRVLPPGEFAQKMREIAELGDAEIAHHEADYLMLDVLDALGYREGVEAFRSMTRHYA